MKLAVEQRLRGREGGVLVKVGHWHATKGLNPGDVFALGNFISEISRLDGKSSFHLNPQVINRPGQHWSLTDHSEYAALTAVASPDRWTLVDLRPLRPAIHAGLDASPEIRAMAFGFDAVLMIGDTHEGTIEWAAPLLGAAKK